ncbi:putative cystathionine gamma-lyase 2 isoform X1 [Spodoptera frugiperda]|uniref:cystathionine gamma-lyase n=2 Tax=Spodoptera frugiperda TaxID=7108 RepID=A0A9R0EZ83_SPOFR|nr:putative cystathionine gamma-lyase 2 isoform X1 [Spodoptera frugiperda]
MSKMADGHGALKRKPGFATLSIHSGLNPDQWNGAIVPPIVLTAMYKQPSNGNLGYTYSRTANPMRDTLETCLAALEGGKHAFTFASGHGVIMSVLALLGKGDHIVSMDNVYGGTGQVMRENLPKLGIDLTFTDVRNVRNLENAIQDNTKIVWLETPTNPNCRVIDIAATVQIVKKRNENIIVVVDNTFLTCYLQRPLDFGADIVVYSLTKYVNGHSDVVMGAAVVNKQEIADNLRYIQESHGSVPSPFDCYLVNRSLKTLSLRMERHKATALVIAEWLEKHPNIIEVNHPGLKSHKGHEIFKKQTSGHSGIFSFKHSGGLQESRKLLTCFKVFLVAESLGGYESLVEIPAVMTHKTVPQLQKTKLGITDSMIRISIGLEDAEDLIADLENAFKKTFT